jgi:hypothetical protein
MISLHRLKASHLESPFEATSEFVSQDLLERVDRAMYLSRMNAT